MTRRITTRFAPSPTGMLHLGHAYSALAAHDFARARNGRFLLRFEDIDPGRVREQYYAAIEEDLRWLGLAWDEEPLRQSARYTAYQAAIDTLAARALVYPCFCTRKEIAAEIAASASAPHVRSGTGGIDGPFYPGTCRALDRAEREARMAGEAFAWRLDMARSTALAGPLFWEDATLERIAARPALHGDIVLTRKDAPASYALAVVVDDAAQAVTDILRGKDLVAATDVQRLLQALLDLPQPHYHHHELVTDESGKRLAKRDDARSLHTLRRTGADPQAIVAALRAGPKVPDALFRSG